MEKIIMVASSKESPFDTCLKTICTIDSTAMSHYKTARGNFGHDDYCDCCRCVKNMKDNIKTLRREMDELKNMRSDIEKLKTKIRYAPGQEGAIEAEMEFRSLNPQLNIGQ